MTGMMWEDSLFSPFYKRISVYIVTICLRILQQEAAEQNKTGTVL